MRICYLILCHKNEKQIASLVEQLDDKDVVFCIHVDKKANLVPPPKKAMSILLMMIAVSILNGAIWGWLLQH